MEASVFITNRTQAVRLPAEMRFANDVKRVSVRAIGNERILTPINHHWDSFFLGGAKVSDDFMAEREISVQPEREEF
ncbi:type II toxin-antitoxin system VapB family antitoxin [Glaesserella sp.]|uniref:type II toxin-antitoxin system VapB family antitoxin n=1 Tax=Glaesserella sp. TaxID=2094731 RepID=UPI00359F57A2